MDLSKLPDAQRQQLEQLQKQFQEHQKKQQEESASAAAAAAVQQPPPPAAYDPSQVHQSYDPSQAYDQSYYYNYNQQQQQQQQPQAQQYDASYYQNYHPNAYQQQQQQHQYMHPETSAATAATAVYTVPSEQQRNEGGLGLGHGHGHVQVQDPYVDPSNQVNSGGAQPNPGYPVPPGLNAAAAAAVAALSQLTQFAGSMGAAERAMGGGGYGPPMGGGGHYGQGHFRPPAGHSPYRGGGRRGGGPFRGGGRGFRPPSSGGSGPPFHGRGRGRGSGRGGRGRGGRHEQSSSSHPETSAVEEAKPPEGAEPSAQPNPQQPSRIAWCELCRVDCTSKEILEQHKSGKRHKKNLHKLQGTKGAYQPAAETQKDENPVTETGSEQEADKQPKIGTTDDNKVETEETDGQEKKPWMNTKRKMRGGGRGGGRGAKRQRQGATGPLKPKIVIPLMCDLCNVKCDTQEVFDRHVAGKKHVAKLKRFEGHQAMYGPTAVQALYPPNPLSQTMGPQPGYYGAPASYPPPPAAAAAAASSDAYVPPAPSQAQNPNPQLADAPLEFGTKNEAPQVAATGETHAGNGV